MKEREVDLGRLTDAIYRDRLALRFPREMRKEIWRKIAGNNWSEEGTGYTNPVNLLDLYVSVVGRLLCPKNPRLMLSTFDRQNKPAVSAMQSWANREVVRMKLANSIKRCVLDALVGPMGIMKVALADPGDSAMAAWNLKAGQPFAEPIDFDDWVHDTHCRRFEQWAYCGHRLRLPLDVVKDSKLYSKERLQLEPDVDDPYNPTGDERISMLGRTYYSTNAEEFEDMVTLWEIYVPRHRLIFTFHNDSVQGAQSVKGSGLYGKALRVQKWLGPESGPVHILGYKTIGGNAMPKGPCSDLVDLHDPANNVYRKLIEQARRQKTIGACQGGADADGNRVVKAVDGEMIRFDQPDQVREVMYGGPNQQNFLMGGHLVDKFDEFAGNLRMLGGMAPQSKTLGQDKLLAGNASSQVSSMQEDTTDHTSLVARALCWYWWNHPTLAMRVNQSLPGLPDMGIQRTVTPSQRMRGRFDDLEIEIDPYSMQHQTPEQRSAALDQVVTQIIVPMAQVLQAQGIQFDANAYLQKRGAYMDMPDLSEIVSVSDPPQPDDASPSGGSPTTSPPTTTRNYVRRSLGQDTPANRDAKLQNALNAAQPSTNGAAK